MGSMSREALGSARSVLSDLGGSVDLTTGEQLLDAGRVIGGSVQLQSYLADPAVDVSTKKQLLDRLFERDGAGAALVRARTCLGCHLMLSGTDLNVLRQAPDDEVVTCPQCGCILVRTAESGL